MRTLFHTLKHGAIAIVVLGLAACAPRPAASDMPRTESYAVTADTSTPLGQSLAPLVKRHAGLSGFRLLTTGIDAFATRIAMIRSATKSVDVQYYNVESDMTGQVLLKELLRAADRGVRIRVLIDNLNLENPNGIMSVMDQHENIEIRGFNPVTTEDQNLWETAAAWITDGNRYTKRMHNKALIADGWMATVGGRNLGDEYFGAGDDFNFNDLDVLTAGPIVRPISQSFDRYWNSRESFPLQSLDVEAPDPKKTQEIDAELDRHWQEAFASEVGRALKVDAYPEQLREGKVKLTWAKGQVAADAPEKVLEETEDTTSPPLSKLVQLLDNAKSEFVAVSPYFVPGDDGVKALSDLVQRGVKVRVLTNSLASTDVAVVHVGYRRYREKLLENGIELFEFKPIPGKTSRQNAPGSRPRSSLHSKVYVVDRKDVVVASFNLDPRSIEHNTEIAVVIHSQELAEQIITMFNRAASPANSYHVHWTNDPQLTGAHDHQKRLVWESEEKSGTVYSDEEPEASLWRDIQTTIFSVLPLENHL